MSEIDYSRSRIRNAPLCPVCIMPKPKGLVICWTCNGNLKRQHDGNWGEQTERLLLRVENMLASAGEGLSYER